MSDEQDKLQSVEKDGGDAKPDLERLDQLKALVDSIKTQAGQSFASNRQAYSDALYCRWPGQSTDGRKHKAALGKDPLPFEGASDSRIRHSDGIIARRTAAQVKAAMLALPTATAVEGGDASGAAKASTLLQWLVRNRWGQSAWRRTLKLLARWKEAETPAISWAYVDWVTERCLQYRTITRIEMAAQLLDALSQAQGVEEADDPRLAAMQAEVTDLITNPARVNELAAALRAMTPEEVPDSRLKQAAKDLVGGGSADIPMPYTKINEPRVEPLQAYVDLFYADDTADPQRASGYILRRFYSRAECLERARAEDWSKAFLEGLIGKEKDDVGQEGKTAFADFEDDQQKGETNVPVDPHKGKYEVLYAFTRAANEDGVLGIYQDIFSYNVETPATGRKLWDRKHGKYPFVPFARETLGQRINDSRSVPEVSLSDQQAIKLVSDSVEDHVQVNTNKPIGVPRGRPFLRASLGPFGAVEIDRNDSIRPIELGDYPRAAFDHRDEIRRRSAEYWGEFDPKIMPNQTLADLLQQDHVDDFLSGLADVFQLVFQLCQERMDDAMIQRVVGGNGMPIARSVEEIQGQYDIRITFDVRDLNMDTVLSKVELALKARSLDRNGVISWEPFLRQVIASVDPNWADALPTAEVAAERVAADERNNLVQILNGVEPPMPEVIDAPGFRLQVLEAAMQPRLANAGAYPPISAASAAFYDNRINYLTFQQQQQENADIGRVGAEPLNPVTLEANR